MTRQGVQAKVTYKQDSFSVRSVTAYRKTEEHLDADLDFTEVDFAFSNAFEDSKVFTQELLLSSTRNDRFEWLAGVFFLHEDASAGNDVRLSLLDVRSHVTAEVSTSAQGTSNDSSASRSCSKRSMLPPRDAQVE